MNTILKSKTLSLVGALALFLFVYFSLPPHIEESFLKLIAVLDWPVTIIVLAFFFHRIFTYVFFSLDAYNFFGLSGTLRPVADIIDEQVERRLREEKEREKKDALLMRHHEVPEEIVDYMNMQEEELNELRARVADLSSATILERAVKEEIARRGRGEY